ncbi:hypothetical protein PTTG_27927 [Puccinia triticina 1-1 BBBD Race 1]|uniref:Uncharacterized protein n=1 Tax=Puccinia triticina (isolate 1-1 / race 1 (BBBD)) TaxID=630390 RepID=A0A180GGB2_PUCT1|nr:hypothetical protein PTTG_27927 [Puccinia triticina 1-1 BBBD Race 1]
MDLFENQRVGPRDNPNPGAPPNYSTPGSGSEFLARRSAPPSSLSTEILPQGPNFTPTLSGQSGGGFFRRVLDRSPSNSLANNNDLSPPALPPPLQLDVNPPNTPAPNTKPARKKCAPRARNTTIPVSPSTSQVSHPPPRDPTPEPDLSQFQGCNKRFKLSAETMEKIRHQPLDTLRRIVVKDPEYKRLTIANKLKLDQAYLDYQSAVHLIAIKNKLEIKPVLHYLGNKVHIRSGNCYNDFCKYDPEAVAIKHNETITSNERAIKCGALWRGLTQEAREQWKDQDYIDSLACVNSVTSIPAETDHLPEDETSVPPTRTLRSNRFSLKSWTHKVTRDLRNLSTAHQVEGYVVLASRDPVQPVLLTGGSHMAEEFLDILEPEKNQCNSFFKFVSGKQAIKDVSGRLPPPINPRKRRRGIESNDPDCPYDLGSKVANSDEVQRLLQEALTKATHGVCVTGWPGENTAATLRELGVTLFVQPNDLLIAPAEFCKAPTKMRIGTTRRILTAFAKGWVKITGPPAPDPGPIGLCPNAENSDDNLAPPPKKVIYPKEACHHRALVLRL